MALSDKNKKLVDAILADPRYGRFPRSVIEFIVDFDAANGIDWVKKHERKSKRAPKATPAEPGRSLEQVEEVVEYGVIVSEKLPKSIQTDGEPEAPGEDAGTRERHVVLL